MRLTSRWIAVPAMLLAAACSKGAPATAAAPAASAASVSDFAGGLASQLGVTSSQASGGLGSMLSLAESKLSPADFDKLKGAMPNASSYTDAAKRAGITEPITDVGGLNKALGKLGMSPDQVSKFVPTVADALGKTAGGSTKNMLMGLLQ
jgi:hypothetical protein